MRLLLDTNILIWILTGDDERLKPATRVLIDQADEVYFSPASIWEIAIKAGTGKLEMNAARAASLLASILGELDITSQHTAHVQGLPDKHKDPFDRLLLSQAMCEGMTLLSSDHVFSQYDPAGKYSLII
ncbi:type II toxin-antitoxin system VapC family toxin [Kushneria sp. AK178]